MLPKCLLLFSLFWEILPRLLKIPLHVFQKFFQGFLREFIQVLYHALLKELLKKYKDSIVNSRSQRNVSRNFLSDSSKKSSIFCSVVLAGIISRNPVKTHTEIPSWIPQCLNSILSEIHPWFSRRIALGISFWIFSGNYLKKNAFGSPDIPPGIATGIY